MDISAPQLLELQVDALFTHDASGRIVAINEPGGGPAPRFFLGRTRTGILWRVRYDLPETAARRLEALAASEPEQDGLQAEPRNMAAYLEALRGTARSRRSSLAPPTASPTRCPRRRLA